MTPGCQAPISEATLIDYWARDLEDADEADRVEAHLFGCADCSARLEHLAVLGAGVTTLALTKGASTTWRAAFAVQRPARDRLLLEGEMDGHRIRARLALVELDTFRLLNSTFRWVRPPDPFAG